MANQSELKLRAVQSLLQAYLKYEPAKETLALKDFLSEDTLNAEKKIRRFYLAERLSAQLFNINFSELEKKLFVMLEKLYLLPLASSNPNDFQMTADELPYAINFVAHMRRLKLLGALYFDPKKKHEDFLFLEEESPGNEWLIRHEDFFDVCNSFKPLQFQVNHIEEAQALTELVLDGDGLGFVVIMELLPEAVRLDFVRASSNKINKCNIANVLRLLPEKERFLFIKKNAHLVSSANFSIILVFLPEKNRYDFCNRHKKYMISPDVQGVALKSLPEEYRVSLLIKDPDQREPIFFETQYRLPFTCLLNDLSTETLRKIYPHFKSSRILECLAFILPCMLEDEHFSFIQKHVNKLTEELKDNGLNTTLPFRGLIDAIRKGILNHIKGSERYALVSLFKFKDTFLLDQFLTIMAFLPIDFRHLFLWQYEDVVNSGNLDEVLSLLRGIQRCKIALAFSKHIIPSNLGKCARLIKHNEIDIYNDFILPQIKCITSYNLPEIMALIPAAQQADFLERCNNFIDRGNTLSIALLLPADQRGKFLLGREIYFSNEILLLPLNEIRELLQHIEIKSVACLIGITSVLPEEERYEFVNEHRDIIQKYLEGNSFNLLTRVKRIIDICSLLPERVRDSFMSTVFQNPFINANIFFHMVFSLPTVKNFSLPLESFYQDIHMALVFLFMLPAGLEKLTVHVDRPELESQGVAQLMTFFHDF